MSNCSSWSSWIVPIIILDFIIPLGNSLVTFVNENEETQSPNQNCFIVYLEYRVRTCLPMRYRYFLPSIHHDMWLHYVRMYQSQLAFRHILVPCCLIHHRIVVQAHSVCFDIRCASLTLVVWMSRVVFRFLARILRNKIKYRLVYNYFTCYGFTYFLRI